MARITPVILSGGAGTRLWPLSRKAHPKPFLPLTGSTSLFAHTLMRTNNAAKFTPPLIVGSASDRQWVDAACTDSEVIPKVVLLEPCGRNTAPAIALAAHAAGGDETLLLVMPSDHVIENTQAFLAAIKDALPAAQDGWLVTFGITPDRPETGYGYIGMSDGQVDNSNARQVMEFIEKPPLEKAEKLTAGGRHAWNSGIFLFRADRYLHELERHAPDIAAACKAAYDGATQDGHAVHPDAAAFAQCRSESIDYAVMEKADRVAVVPVDCGWSDLGSFDALYGIGEPGDTDGNVVRGEAVLVDAKNCLVHGDGVKITAAGVDDLIIVATKDHVLVVPRGASQDVKRIVERLDEADK